MELTNPAVANGAALFVNIVVIIVALAAAIAFVDARKEKKKNPQ